VVRVRVGTETTREMSVSENVEYIREMSSSARCMCSLRQIQPLLLLALLFALHLPSMSPRSPRKHVIEGSATNLNIVPACLHLLSPRSNRPCSLCVTFLKQELSCMLNCITIATPRRLIGVNDDHFSRNIETRLPSQSPFTCQIVSTPLRGPQGPSHHNTSPCLRGHFGLSIGLRESSRSF
jgi:hypothetical protein